MTDLLVTGAYGQLGRATLAAAHRRGLAAVGHDLDTLDITARASVEEMMTRIGPAAVLNCAAYTQVDACEEHEELATRVNGEAVGVLAEACNRHGAVLVQVSTDYVFPGTATTPYHEDDQVGPINAYGRSKLLGEEIAQRAHHHLVVRTAWLYGGPSGTFVEAIRAQLAQGTASLRVVADQTGSPTLCDDLAGAILGLLAVGARGLVHAVNSGSTTWHGFAEEIVHRSHATAEVIPVATTEFPRPAPRPAYSVLDTGRLSRLLGAPLPTWQDALARYLEAPCGS